MSDMEQSDVAPEAPAEAPAAEAAPKPVPVVAQQPSSASPTQAPEAEAPREPVSLEDAARVVVILVKAHRTIGDSDLAAAVADVEAALPEVEEPEEDAAAAEAAAKEAAEAEEAAQAERNRQAAEAAGTLPSA